jgi:hypothetical protein
VRQGTVTATLPSKLISPEHSIAGVLFPLAGLDQSSCCWVAFDPGRSLKIASVGFVGRSNRERTGR